MSVKINVWADIFHPVSHINIESNKPLTVYAAYENWRFEDRVLTENEKEVCRTYKGAPSKAVVRRDSVRFEKDGVLFYHRNFGETAFDVAVRQQKLEGVKNRLWNPLSGIMYGGRLSGDNMKIYDQVSGRYASTDFRAWRLKSVSPALKHHIQVAYHTEQVASEEEWLSDLKTLETEVRGKVHDTKKKALSWWAEFWNRSYIYVDNNCPDPKNERWQVGRNYQVFRYQLACNAYGKYPTKFNGGLFTVDPEFIDSIMTYSPDFRKWGGGSFTAQNQRLVYWPMLKSGDFDMMPSQFDFYNNLLSNAELRSLHYWNHGGACFTEQIENFGLPVGFEYGWKRPARFDSGVQYNSWVEYQWDTVFEFCMMMVEAYRYNRMDISKYIPLMLSCLKFYDEHYQYLSALRTPKRLDSDGKLVLYPATALETYKMATNPITTITAMNCLAAALIDLPETFLTVKERDYLVSLRTRIPETIHYRMKNGYKTFSPAQSWERINNMEFPQLYTVFPWGVHHIDAPELDIARNTWYYGADIPNQKGYKSWEQSAIFCARLGLRKEAAEFTLKKMKDSGRRFPTWWGPGHDWTPDHNWGGCGMIGLQEMIMQCYGDKIYIGAGLPDDWNVDFRLHAPKQTIVEGRIRYGKLEYIDVTPKERMKDIMVWLGKK